MRLQLFVNSNRQRNLASCSRWLWLRLIAWHECSNIPNSHSSPCSEKNGWPLLTQAVPTYFSTHPISVEPSASAPPPRWRPADPKRTAPLDPAPPTSVRRRKLPATRLAGRFGRPPGRGGESHRSDRPVSSSGDLTLWRAASTGGPAATRPGPGGLEESPWPLSFVRPKNREKRGELGLECHWEKRVLS